MLSLATSETSPKKTMVIISNFELIEKIQNGGFDGLMPQEKPESTIQQPAPLSDY
jgi:hypothetical protein